MGVEKQDSGSRYEHIPNWALDNFIRRLTDNPNQYCSYVTKGQVVADLGSGPGWYTLSLAESVGPEGKVYAVDINEKAIRAIEKKANKHIFHNIEAHATSASDLNFIKDGSVDFVLANGLLCSMAPKYREATVNEIKRILKPSGKAYLSLGQRPPLGYVDREEWAKILERFRVEQRDSSRDMWAVVSINTSARYKSFLGA